MKEFRITRLWPLEIYRIEEKRKNWLTSRWKVCKDPYFRAGRLTPEREFDSPWHETFLLSAAQREIARLEKVEMEAFLRKNDCWQPAIW